MTLQPLPTNLRLFNLMIITGAVVTMMIIAWLVYRTADDVQERTLKQSAIAYSSAVSSIRSFYNSEILPNVAGHPWVEVTEHYKGQPGALPIPATLSLDLGDYLSARDDSVSVRLVSEYPFPQRADRELYDFDRMALQYLSMTGGNDYQARVMLDGVDTISYATPIRMEAGCVGCHNNHPDSPFKSWQLGDIRGIQVISLNVPSGVMNIGANGFSLGVFALGVFLAGLTMLFAMNRRVRSAFRLLNSRNDELQVAMLELQQRQAAIDEHAIVSITDIRGDIIYINRKFIDITGYTPEELIGFNHRLINSQYHPQAMFAGLWSTISSGGTWSGEIRNRSKDGLYYWVKATIMPLRNLQGQIDRYISVRTDITHAKALEERLLNQNRQLSQMMEELDAARIEAERISEAKSQFLANMSHEVRTPMNGIIGMTDLALNTTLSPEQRNYLETVKSSAKGLMRILNDILDFSKIDAGKLCIEQIECDLGELVCDSLKPLVMLARKKNLLLSLDMPAETCVRLYTDPVRLRQVLSNLCDNAIKFTQQGSVLVRVRVVTAETGGTHLVFDVIDDGVGIEAEKIEQIFSPFEQADNSTTRCFGGTGLGLSICQRLVALMGGGIRVVSEPGKGACFSFWLPLASSVEPETSFSVVPFSAVPVSKGEIQLALENLPMAETLRSWLTAMGYSVGDLSLTDHSQHTDPPTCLIMDTRFMHQADFSLCDSYDASLRRQPVILLADELLVREEGVKVDWQVKVQLTMPPRPSELRAAIECIRGAGAGILKSIDPQRPEDSVLAGIKQQALSILVAEDNRVNQQLIMALLKKRGHSVDLVEDGEAAVIACQTKAYDLILMDMQMPRVNGVEAARQIRQWESDNGRVSIPIYALTANVMESDINACLAAGMSGHLSKPLDVGLLDSVLAGVIPQVVTASITGEKNA
ncbi:ATP-binding protein [Nitrincola alkalilacustris]|uniref:ATP-binding protein n=1 Tax=Nitrincola alkalilacustris TaxID=1571224 RepID=UPI00124E92E9|nr:ATP-binding protein [Nitrincola alkalilacustris]